MVLTSLSMLFIVWVLLLQVSVYCTASVDCFSGFLNAPIFESHSRAAHLCTLTKSLRTRSRQLLFSRIENFRSLHLDPHQNQIGPLSAAPETLSSDHLSAASGPSKSVDSVDNDFARKRCRHPVFANTNVVSKLMPVPHPQLWEKFLPVTTHEPAASSSALQPSFWEWARNSILASPNNRDESKHNHGDPLINDVSVKFVDPAAGAREIMEKCGILSHAESDDLPLPETCMVEETETFQHLTHVLSYYQSIAHADLTLRSSKNSSNEFPQCQARIVATRGSIGTKCPRWHADYVPVRLVMSLLGPGCDYIPFENELLQEHPEKMVELFERRALVNIGDEDANMASYEIVPSKLLELTDKVTDEGNLNADASSMIQHAKEGEAVLLMGREWEDASIASIDEWSQLQKIDNRVMAAVHRSPMLTPHQKRILLTVDVVDDANL